jgi:hypothetical protein
MIRLFFGCIAANFAAAGWVFGASSSFEFTVAAGRQERDNVPVRVQMSRGQIGQNGLPPSHSPELMESRSRRNGRAPASLQAARARCILFCHIWRLANRFD